MISVAWSASAGAHHAVATFVSPSITSQSRARIVTTITYNRRRRELGVVVIARASSTPLCLSECPSCDARYADATAACWAALSASAPSPRPCAKPALQPGGPIRRPPRRRLRGCQGPRCTC
jgi:hypothetical protein